jgi:hypothetical protein
MMNAFALSPAMAVQGIIDYSTREGRGIFHDATAKVDEELYDCKPDGLYQFLQSVNNRAHEFGWDDEINGVLWIPEDPLDPISATRSLIESYGTISMDEIRAFENTYISLPIRPAQDSYMMYKCLMNSITKEGKSKITIWSAQFTVNGYPSGNLLLKVIIRESHLDTNATVISIKTKLSSLDSYILTIGSDITKFNGYVKLLVDSLTSRGQTTTDLLTNLFKGYTSASDKTFVDYIERKKERYEEGESISPEELMELADNKYKLLKEAGKWNAPSQDEEKILALHAEIKNLKKHSKKKVSFQKDDKKKKKYDKGSHKEKPAWFSTKPADSDLKKAKTWNDKKWWYCCPETGGKCEGNWRIHTPKECKGTATKSAGKKKSEDGSNTGSNKKLKLAQALQAIQASSEDDMSVSVEED